VLRSVALQVCLADYTAAMRVRATLQSSRWVPLGGAAGMS
jgi:hypothetical protein